MKKFFIYLPITILMLISSKLFSTEVQSGAKEFETKGKKGIELIEKIAKRYLEVSLDPVKSKTQNPYPTKEEIKELKSLTPYLPKKVSQKDQDYTNIINELNKIPNSSLAEPKTDQEKQAKTKYSKPGLKPEEVK